MGQVVWFLKTLSTTTFSVMVSKNHLTTALSYNSFLSTSPAMVKQCLTLREEYKGP